MPIRKTRRAASPNGRRRVKSPKRRAPPSRREIVLRAELNTMREIVVVLVQAITDLFDCLPKDLYQGEKVSRIETTLAGVHALLAKRRKKWEADELEQTQSSSRPTKARH